MDSTVYNNDEAGIGGVNISVSNIMSRYFVYILILMGFSVKL